MRWQAVISICILVAGMLLACSPLGLLQGNSPEGVTKRFWMALEKNDQDAMLDCIEPSIRPGLDPFSKVLPLGTDWLVMIIHAAEKEAGKKIIELGKMQFKELDNDGTTAHVRVSGRVKLPEWVPIIGGIVREFQIVHTVVKEEGRWYLSSPR